MPKYSIITPCYNSYHLMNKYFDSLNNQTYKDFEVIIIDDCSIDDSFEKLEEYLKQSQLNIKLYKTDTNMGPGNARNIGIEKATGDYITFIDNDDWVDYKLLEKVNKVISENKVDCVIYDYYIKKDKSESVAKSMYKGNKGIVSLSDCIVYVRNHTFGKFYKASKCRFIKFPTLKRCEDVAFVVRAIDVCESVYYLDEPLYYYYQRSCSLSNNKILDESDMIKAFSIIENVLGEKYPNELKEKSVTDLLYGVILMMCKSGKSNSDIKNYIKKYEEKYPKWWKCEIINYMGTGKKIYLKTIQLRFIGVTKILTKIHSKIIG